MAAPAEWLWLCRAGSEGDLLDELAGHKGVSGAARVAAGLVRSTGRPRLQGEPVELAFARQGFPVDARIESAPEAGALAGAVAARIAPALAGPFALHVFVADSDEANPLAPYAAQVEQALAGALDGGRRVPAHEAPEGTTPLGQVLVTARGRAAVGVMPVAQAASLAPGGRRRIGAPARSPSRAAAKLLEAFDWLGRAPEPGELCIDLGAAPGGWSYVLLERRAKVLAIDPARLAPSLQRHKNLRHLPRSAFEYLPEEPADWLLCDMAWRPLEVAALLAKWGRRGSARFLVANFKLPMKKKVEMIGRLREILATGGWRNVRFRQLYHDREEVTAGAWRI